MVYGWVFLKGGADTECVFFSRLSFLRLEINPVKHTQTIRWQKPTNCLSVFDHFVGLALKGLKLCYMCKRKFFSFSTILQKNVILSNKCQLSVR